MAAPKVNYGQKFIWMLEAAAFDLVAALARLFPVDAVSDFGAFVFRTVGPRTGLNRIAERNLRIVFPNLNDDEFNRIMAAQWEELGRSMAEFPIVDRIVSDTTRISVTGVTRLHQIAAGEGPVVFISGHFSNIEVMAAAIVEAGVQCQVTYRAMNNPYVDERVRKGRARYGVRLFAPKGLSGARELMRALDRGESIALLNDQKFNQGVAAPFFGQIVHTAPGPSTYALLYGIPLQPMSVQRRGKARFEVIVHEPIHLEDTGAREADIEAGVRRVNAFIEDCVRARPTEWFWVHKRWPNDTYKRA